MSKERRLPSGRMTRSSDEYLARWSDITLAIEKRLDCDVYSYDPGIAIKIKDEYGTKSCTLPMWLVERILKCTQ